MSFNASHHDLPFEYNTGVHLHSYVTLCAPAGDFYNDYDASDFNQDYIGGRESQVNQSAINDDHCNTYLAVQVDYSVDYRVDYGGGDEGLRGPHQQHDRLEGAFDQVFYKEDHFDYLQYQDLF